MIRVTIRSGGERDIVVDEVKKVSQMRRGKFGMEEVTAWGDSAILSHHFIPGQPIVVEGESKICAVAGNRAEVIEAEVIEGVNIYGRETE